MNSAIAVHRPLWIVGSGAVGLTLATLLSTQRNVALFTRKQRRNELVGASLRVSGSRIVEAPPHSIVVESVETVSPPRTAIDAWLAVKAHDVLPTLREIAPLLPAASTVVVLSNGLGIYDDVRASVAPDIRVLRVLPSFGAYRTSPTETRLAGDLVFTVAGDLSDSSVTEQTAAILSGLGAHVITERDVRLAEWRKAVINLVVNPLCSLADRENNAMSAEPTLRSMIPFLLREIAGVAAGEGVSLDSLSADDLVQRLAPHASNLNSMLIDLRNGRPTEIDYITGRFITLAERHGVATPLMRSIYDTIKTAEKRSLRPLET